MSPTHLHCPICVDGSCRRIGSQDAIEEGDELGVVGLLVELEVDDVLQEQLEGGGAEAAQHLGGGGHLLLADQEALVVPLQPAMAPNRG